MRKSSAILLALLLLPLTLVAQDTWVQDPAHSRLGFTVTHLGISDIPGHFEEYDVAITASEEDFSDAQVELKVQTASINTRVQDRDDHLRSADFFHVEEYPEMKIGRASCRE